MIYKIKLLGEYDKELIKTIKQDNEEQQGLMELYNNLISLGYTESYNQDRIYSVANTLSANNIKFKVTQV